jgi:hypothetical protein
MGTFEFRVCNLDQDPKSDATQACLDLNQLKLSTGEDVYTVRRDDRIVRINVTLPNDFTCEHCVFQWKYRTGNSWGVSKGKGCLGCGRENEEFYGCADVAITKTGETTVPSGKPTQEIERAVAPRQCSLAATFSSSFDITETMEKYCQTVCSTDCKADNTAGNALLHKNCRKTCEQLCACI